MSQGWISIHRQFKEWEWYGDSKIVHLFLHCLMSANHKPKQWRGRQIEAGQFITSQSHLSQDTGLSVRQVRTILDKLKLTGELTVQITNKFSIISITNWDKFQGVDRQDVSQVTTKRQSNDTQLTTNNNDNNANNVNNDNKKPKAKKASPSKIEKPSDVEEEVWQDWQHLRKTKRAPVTNTVLKGAIREAEKAKVSLNEFLQIWCRRGSQGLEASWIKQDEITKPADKHGGFDKKDYQSGAITPEWAK